MLLVSCVAQAEATVDGKEQRVRELVRRLRSLPCAIVPESTLQALEGVSDWRQAIALLAPGVPRAGIDGFDATAGLIVVLAGADSCVPLATVAVNALRNADAQLCLVRAVQRALPASAVCSLDFLALIAAHAPPQDLALLLRDCDDVNRLAQVCAAHSRRAVDGLVEALVILDVAGPAVLQRRVKLRIATARGQCAASNSAAGLAEGFLSRADGRLLAWARGQSGGGGDDDVALAAVESLNANEAALLFAQACAVDSDPADDGAESPWKRLRRSHVADAFAAAVTLRPVVVRRGASAASLANNPRAQALCGQALEVIAKSHPGDAARLFAALLHSQAGSAATAYKLALPRRMHGVFGPWLRAGERLALAAAPPFAPVPDTAPLWLAVLRNSVPLNTAAALVGAALAAASGTTAASQATPEDPDDTLVSAWTSGAVDAAARRCVGRNDDAALSPWLWALDVAARAGRLKPGPLPPLRQSSQDALPGLLREVVFGSRQAGESATTSVGAVYRAVARLLLRRSALLSDAAEEDLASLSLIARTAATLGDADGLACGLATELARKSPMHVSAAAARDGVPDFASLALDHIVQWLPLGGCPKCSDGSESNFGFDVVWRAYAWSGCTQVLDVLARGFETAWRAQVQSQGATSRLSVVCSRVMAAAVAAATAAGRDNSRVVNQALRVLGAVTATGPAGRSCVVDSLAWPFLVECVRGERGRSARVNALVLIDEVCKDAAADRTSAGMFRMKTEEKLVQAERAYSLCALLLAQAGSVGDDACAALYACASLLALQRMREGPKTELVAAVLAFLEARAQAWEQATWRPFGEALGAFQGFVNAAATSTPLLFQVRSGGGELAARLGAMLDGLGMPGLAHKVVG